MAKFYRKKKNIFGSTIAILLVAVIAGSTLAYFFNSSFKSKVNDILKIEQKAETPEDKNNNPEETGSVGSDELNKLKQQLADSNAEVEALKSQIANAEKDISYLSSNVSNPNLLINANFRINERGKQEYTREGSDIYTVDRWCLAKGNGSYNFYTKTLTGADESSSTVFCQWIEDAQHLVFGKTITASATVNGVRVSKTFEMPETYSEDTIFNVYECNDFVFRLYVSSVYKYLGVQFLVENEKSIVIEEVKVEESSFATKFVDRLYDEDLTLCKRYYQELSTQSIGYAANTERIVFFASSPQSMRKVTVYQMKNNPQILKDGERIAVSEVKVQITSDNGLMLYAVGSDFTQFETYFLMGGTIYADGEIYLDFVI